jgi:hypothetical protein
VVQVDVGEQRRNPRALPRPPVARRYDPVFQDARLQPFLDQTDDALVADAMLDETDEPFLAHRIEELLDVGVEYPVHLPGYDSHHQRIHRVMRAAPRSEPIAEAEEVFLVNRVQHHRRRPLDDPRVKPEDKPCPPAQRSPAGAVVRPAWV